ncbi:MAG: hypothetical protein KDD37_02745 [Bdellovibrionales bacterium]|nr:hypothetical protein [Bdellovibrionales bacterium]
MSIFKLVKISSMVLLISSMTVQANAQRDRRGDRDRPERSQPQTRREPTRSAPERSAPPSRAPQIERQRQPRANPPAPTSPRVDRQPRVNPQTPTAPRVERNRERDRQPRVNPQTPTTPRVERNRERDRQPRVNPQTPGHTRPNQQGHHGQARQHRRNFERPVHVRHNGRDLVERSRYRHDHGREIRVNRYYRPYRWGRHDLYSYRSYWSFNIGFWSFYRHRYVSPWRYTWGWASSPWYRGWAWYYTPYSYYYSASYWVTDYVISDLLREQYEEGYADGFRDGWNEARSTGITEEYKEQLRSQVDQTVDAYERDASVSLDEAFRDPNYLFAVDTELTVLDQNNSVCTLSGGDLLRVYSNRPEQEDNYVSMLVATSKGASCRAGSVVNISIDDLQEMLNTFNEKVDDGLNEAQKLQTRLP